MINLPVQHLWFGGQWHCASGLTDPGEQEYLLDMHRPYLQRLAHEGPGKNHIRTSLIGNFCLS